MSSIRDMKLHESGYVVSWAIQMVFGKPTICLNYDVSAEPAGTRNLLLTRTEDGYIANGWKPEEERPSHAVISIVTRKYPWTGATDDDVADVTVTSANLADGERGGGGA